MGQANILVQDRRTGQLQEEKMLVGLLFLLFMGLTRPRIVLGLSMSVSASAFFTRATVNAWRAPEVRPLPLGQHQSERPSHLFSSSARRLLKSMSIKQGLKYDSPESAAEIPAFILFHRLDLNGKSRDWLVIQTQD